MTDDQLLTECKKGLNISLTSTAFDGVLKQKLLAVKSFMQDAGVSDTKMEGDLAVGIIVMGVADLWNVQGGEARFSPVFHTLLGQLAIGSNVLTVSSSPADGAVDVAMNVQPSLTFNKRITGYKVRLVSFSTSINIPITVSLDITKKVLTIKPSNSLDSATKYAIVIESVIAYSGQTLDYTVISFITAT
jgi:hypothetical protein